MFDKRYNILILAAFGVILALSLYFATKVKFDYNFEAFFPHDNPELDFYYDFRNKFEPDDNYILIALKRDNGSIFESSFLKKADTFTKEAESLPHIKQIISLTNQYRPIFFAGTPTKIRILDPENPQNFRRDSIKIMNDPRLIGRLISKDASSLTIVINTGHVLSIAESDIFNKELEALLEKYHFDEYHVAGRAHYQSLFVKKARSEFFTYTAASAILIFIILSIIFRKFWGVAIALGSVLIAMVIFLGFLGFFEITLDAMSALFPILILIVGLSDVIHIMSKYVDEVSQGKSRKEAIQITVREIGFATFLTSATTAIGFASLFTSSIPPIRNFGITAAIGVFIAYVSVMIFTTAIITLFGAEHIIRKKRKKSYWDKIMHWFYIITRKNKKIIGIASLGVFIVSLYGLTLISTDVHIEGNFPRMDKVRNDFRFFEKEYGGVRTLEMGIITKSGYLVDDFEVLQQIDSLEKYIEEYPSFSSVFSPTTTYKSLNQAYYADNSLSYRLPQDSGLYQMYRELVESAPASVVNVVVSEDQKFGRLTAKMIDKGSDSNKEIRQEISNWIAQNLDTSIVTFRHTGTSFLFDKNNEYLRSSLFTGLGLAFIIISILMALLFRNWKMVIISLIPNVFPLVIAGAILGFLGIELDAATSVIFAIAFGIAVDDTIHFLSKFKLEINKGRNISEAVKYTFKESGKAICLTTVILFFGFAILATSTYPPTLYIGFLVSVTLLSALISDLFLIPVLLYWFLGVNEKLEIRKFIRKGKNRRIKAPEL